MAESFGETLRRARKEAGLEIRDLAERTRIQGRYIEALESEDWRTVPQGVIGRGFVRAVARELKLPVSELSDRYRAARGEPEPRPTQALPETDWQVDLEPRRKGKAWAIGAAVVLAVAIGVWSWRSLDSGRSTLPAPAPSEPLEKSPGPPPERPAKPQAPAPSPPGEATAPVSPPPAQPAPVAPASTENAREAGGVTTPMRLEILATQKVWLRVVADGGEPQDKVLKPGERLSAAARRALALKLGNASGVKLFWNGEPLGPAGTGPQVVSFLLPRDLGKLRP